VSSALDRAEAAFAARSWSGAAVAYAEADARQPLPAVALEHWGLATFLTGRDAESDTARERAHHAYLAAGDVDGAARVGHALGLTLVIRGESARAGGWFGRVQTLLDEHHLVDSVWRLYLRLSFGMMTLFSGDADAASQEFEQILVQADRYDDHPDLRVAVRNGLGQSLVASGRIEEGLRRLDEVMVGVTTDDDVSPQLVGLMYCAVIEACRRCFDLDRAREWTDALSRWCARQPDLVPYRGQCLVHRAELLQLHGSWPDASAEVERVFAQLGEDPGDMSAGMAHYQRGELHRLRGEDDKAEQSYRKASRCGHDPQPGLALLRVAQGRIADARAALRRAVEETSFSHDRLRLLPAYVEVSVAAGDVDAATDAAAELRHASAQRETPLLVAAAAQAEGRIALAAGDAPAAVRRLRAALTIWQRIGAPYDAATTRVQIAIACRALGDEDTADLELDAARWAFDQLGAAHDLARVQALSRRPAKAPAPGGLTPREAQILRLVATGATNRAIAGELFLSEKTVARHVANIFAKLDVGSRAAATAFAYEHHLV
jgi:DNA-binding CsgD family transcriptional regulator/Tfp pilus assembly protein PilF